MAAAKLKPARKQTLPKVSKARTDIHTRTDEIVKGLDNGSIKVAIVVHLDANGDVGQFVTDGSASRIELIGLAANLLNNLSEQSL